MSQATHYPLPAELEPAQVLATAGEHLTLGRPTTQTSVWTYYDTFDWRLHERGGTLLSRPADRGEGIELLWLEDGKVFKRLRLTGEPPTFARELPEGTFRAALDAVTDVRRLLPVVRVERQVQTAPVENRDGKTTARLRVVERHADEPLRRTAPRALTTVAEVVKLRGYDQEAKALAKVLEKKVGLSPADHSQLGEALDACGRQAGDYTSKVEMKLRHDERADLATRAIHRALLVQLQRNEPGTRDNLDPEFLHDFRVATRRTRSALSQITQVYPEAVTDRFKSEFRWLQQLTNTARDLDVLREDLQRDLTLLPDDEAEALDLLDAFLATEREREQEKIIAGLDSERYRDLVQDWRLFLDNEPTEPPTDAVNAGRTISDLATERLHKLARKVRKRAAAIRPASEAETLHALRIDGKKLRYLLEFFRSLLSKDARKLVKRLKKVQDVLGDWHDAEQQQIALRRAADAMSEAGDAPVDTLLALGRLLTRLDERWARERKRVDDVIGDLVRALADDRITQLVKR